MLFRIGRRYWVLFPILVSTATQCSESPRGGIPTQIVSVEIRLVSQPAPEPPSTTGEQFVYQDCLQGIGLQNTVIPSWRNGEVVALAEKATNTFAYTFRDVPIDFVHTVLVRDVNECRRDSKGDGSVITGVTANGVALERRMPGTRFLAFVVGLDGTVSSSPQ